MTVTVYTKPACIQCDFTFTALEKLGIAYDKVDVSMDPEAMKKVQELGYKQVPVVVTDQAHWSGFRPEKIKGINQRDEAPAQEPQPDVKFGYWSESDGDGSRSFSEDKPDYWDRGFMPNDLNADAIGYAALYPEMEPGTDAESADNWGPVADTPEEAIIAMREAWDHKARVIDALTDRPGREPPSTDRLTRLDNIAQDLAALTDADLAALERVVVGLAMSAPSTERRMDVVNALSEISARQHLARRSSTAKSFDQ